MLHAALDELREHGHTRLSIDAVARRSGVAKATIYRRWGDRDGLVLDVVAWFGAARATVPDTGRFEEDLRLWARSIAAMLADPTAAVLVRAVLATDPRSGHAVRQQFWRTRRDLVRPLVERARDRGEIPPGTDADEVIRHVGAPLYYRFLVLDEPVTPADADRAAAITALATHTALLTHPSP
ncbi:MAG TPA: TetR/AcrR family transcriptional regulator [Mycobacteriales bacterium]|nr:TetR/AcrR family transcriptional regulator [Mycobacteriales bacterium]